MKKEAKALAREAKDSKAKFHGSLRAAIEHAETCGHAIVAAYKSVPSNEWDAWLSAADLTVEEANEFISFANEGRERERQEMMLRNIEWHTAERMQREEDIKADREAGMSWGKLVKKYGSYPNQIKRICGVDVDGQRRAAKEEARRHEAAVRERERREALKRDAERERQRQTVLEMRRAEPSKAIPESYALVRRAVAQLCSFKPVGQDEIELLNKAASGLYAAEDAIAKLAKTRTGVAA